MKERPILFSGEMVRAILDERKTQTRRVVLKSGVDADYDCLGIENGRAIFHANRPAKRKELLMPSFGVDCPYGKPVDRLWAKETWREAPVGKFCPPKSKIPKQLPEGWTVLYRASGDSVIKPIRWRPSIFMPRWASRITLEIVSVRVERLRDITEEDAKAEGVEAVSKVGYSPEHFTAVRAYANLWDSINGKGSWDKNPWVWVITFKRI